MYENAADAKFDCVTMPNITTRIAAEVIGLTIEYSPNRSGDAQFDSICHPSHAAVLSDRQIIGSPLLKGSRFGSSGVRGFEVREFGVRGFGGSEVRRFAVPF